MSSIDPIQWGKFLEKVESLTEKLSEAEEKIDGLTKRLDAVENRYQLGKAGVTGLVVGLGFALYGLKEGFMRLLERLGP